MAFQLVAYPPIAARYGIIRLLRSQSIALVPILLLPAFTPQVRNKCGAIVAVHGALVESWCNRGSIAVQSWCNRGAIAVQSWRHMVLL